MVRPEELGRSGCLQSKIYRLLYLKAGRRYCGPEDKMFNGYPIWPALTSLVLLASLFITPATASHAHSCSDIRRLYAPRMLRELRTRLMLAYAQSHERRAAEIVEAIHTHSAIKPAAQEDHLRIEPQERDDPKMKHLLAYVAMNCL